MLQAASPLLVENLLRFNGIFPFLSKAQEILDAGRQDFILKPNLSQEHDEKTLKHQMKNATHDLQTQINGG